MEVRQRAGVDRIVDELSSTLAPEKRTAFREHLAGNPEKLEQAVIYGLQSNPFIELSHAEISNLEIQRRISGAERELLLLRQLAAKTGGRRVAVFAMPKSGSSFTQAVIGKAARLPFLSLTSIPADGGKIGSLLGINGREQEIDELALVLQTFRGRGNWVAQHHTRFSPYLASQLSFFGIRPIVTVRNIFDALVSMDDMLMHVATGSQSNMVGQLTIALPANYSRLDVNRRLDLLAQDHGFWLIKFLLSWKRAINQDLINPLLLSYERDILNPAAFAQRVSDYLGFDATERKALDQQLAQAPGEDARFNKGIAGRGAALSAEARGMLRAFAHSFRDELGDDGMSYLFGGA